MVAGGGISWLDELKMRDADGVTSRFADDYLTGLADDAVAWVRQMVPSVDRRLASGALRERAYVKTVCDVVMRVLRNPSGRQTESDGVYSYSMNAAVASGNMWLTRDDMAVLEGRAGGMPGTIRVGVERGWGLR